MICMYDCLKRSGMYKIGYQDMSPYKHCSVAISRSENDANIFLPSKTGYWTLQLY